MSASLLIYSMIKKDSCIITYIHDEEYHFPIWIKYYSQFYKQEDIYVIFHNDSNNYDCDNLGFNKLFLNTEYDHDFKQIHSFLKNKCSELLNYYNGIYLAECDEILWHPHGLNNRSKYYYYLPFAAIRCMAYEVPHQMYSGEANLDLTKPLLEQRKIWKENIWQRKPVFFKSAIDYWDNMHNFDEKFTFIDASLVLVHLKTIDYQSMWNRNQKTLQNAKISSYNKENCIGWQNRIESKEDFDIFFKTHLEGCVGIPEKYKTII
jgi:hypothetical protein